MKSLETVSYLLKTPLGINKLISLHKGTQILFLHDRYFFCVQELRSTIRYRAEDTFRGSDDVESVKRALRTTFHAEV